MKRLVLLLWLLAALINSGLFSQSKFASKRSFYDAESLILFEDYKEALPIYKQLLKDYPANSNIKYRIGQCYLKIPGEKDKAISYLEDAVKNISPNYKKGDLKETGAPHDALYFLANAYRINNQLDKALETYELFDKNLNSEVYDSNVVRLQIQSCYNAKQLMGKPVFIKEKNLGNVINGSNSEFNPVISDNEDLLVFSRSGPFYDAILYSIKINGQWSQPINMNELLKVDKDLYPTSISKDGKTLYMYSSANYDGNIYTSRFEKGVWSPIVKLNENINTKYWESHATISHDNKKLYFTSNRKGSLGGLDIYVSNRDSSGNWGPALNLGPVINSAYNEESPFLSQDDKTLFFSSRGHFNMGGYDIFYSTLLPGGGWSVPKNIGYPVNTTDDDIFYDPVNKGFEGYYAKESPGGFGKQDIYRIEIFSTDHPRKFQVKGIAKIGGMMSNITDSVKISILNTKDPGQTITVYSEPKTGKFEFQLPQGNYQAVFEATKSEKIIKYLDLPLTYPSDSFVFPDIILQGNDNVAGQNIGDNKNKPVVEADSILFPAKAEPKDLLTANRRQAGDSLGSSGYKGGITNKQIAAFLSMLINRADDKLKRVITDADIRQKQFGTVDDLLDFLKEEASGKNIAGEDIDRLALKVAVMDNVLSQAAVDLLAKYTDGDLKRILSDLDIYKSNLKTWTDLLEYIRSKTGGKITSSELNKIAGDILAGVDNSISRLREKILAYCDNSEAGNTLRKSVAAADLKNLKLKEKWLQEFYNESVKQGLTPQNMSDMLAAISSMPDTKAEQFLRDVTDQSEEPLLSSLKSFELEKENINSPKDLLLYLLTTKDKAKYPEEPVYKAIANLIIAKDILTGVDPSITRLKEKILVYSDNSRSGTTLRRSVATADLTNMKLREKWLQAFYNESIKQGLSHKQLTDMLAIISSMPDTKAEQFLRDLTDQSEEPLISSLKSIDLNKENINAPKDLLLYLLTSKDKAKYPEEPVYKAIANLIIAKEIPLTTIAAQSASGQKSLLWILWVILGTGLCIIFFIFRKRRKNKEK